MPSSSDRTRPVVRILILILCMVLSAAGVLPAGAATAERIAAATDAACALTDTGAVHCWGGSYSPSTGSFIPQDVTGLGSVVTALDAGQGHWCVVTSVGGAKCWGSNGSGQLGDGTNTSRSAPADVVGLTSGVLAIGAGWSHSCAVTTGGALHCWGENENGQLGDGTKNDSSVPIDVVGLSSGVAAVAGSFGTTCAVTTSGGVKCWGLGRGLTPVDVAGVSDAAAIAVGTDYVCFLTTAGAVRCLGSNDLGQLGDGSNDPSSTPVDVVGLGSGVVAIDALSGHTCALTVAGAVKCWGRNDDGQLGDGSTTNRSTPVTVAGLDSGVVAIAAGEDSSCAVLGDGAVQCWGGGAFHGALGNGFWFDETHKPVHVVDFGPPVCALLSPGQRFASSPAARLLLSSGRFQDNHFDDTISVVADFSLPATVSFSMLHPLVEGARVQLRTSSGAERVDATVPAGAYDPAAKRGWKTSPAGTSTTYLDLAPIAPYGIRRLQIIDRSKGAPGGTVRVKLSAKKGLYRVSPGDEPVEITIVLGDDVAAAAGKCGVSNWGAGDCSFNEPATTLKCRG